MTGIAKYTIAQGYSSANLADAAAMASRASGYYNICQVSSADVVIDNGANLDQNLGVTVELGSWTPAVTDYLELYTMYAPDGTNYENGSASYLPEPDRLWVPKMLSTDTTGAAKRVLLVGPILPYKLKLLWRWKGTNATAATGNKMSWHTFNTNLNG